MTNDDSTTTNDLLVLQMEYQTRVYLADDGCVAIEQPKFDIDGRDVILLSKSQAEHVYLALQAFVEGN